MVFFSAPRFRLSYATLRAFNVRYRWLHISTSLWPPLLSWRWVVSFSPLLLAVLALRLAAAAFRRPSWRCGSRIWGCLHCNMRPPASGSPFPLLDFHMLRWIGTPSFGLSFCCLCFASAASLLSLFFVSPSFTLCAVSAAPSRGCAFFELVALFFLPPAYAARVRVSAFLCIVPSALVVAHDRRRFAASDFRLGGLFRRFFTSLWVSALSRCQGALGGLWGGWWY